MNKLVGFGVWRSLFSEWAVCTCQLGHHVLHIACWGALSPWFASQHPCRSSLVSLCILFPFGFCAGYGSRSDVKTELDLTKRCLPGTQPVIQGSIPILCWTVHIFIIIYWCEVEVSIFSSSFSVCDQWWFVWVSTLRLPPSPSQFTNFMSNRQDTYPPFCKYEHSSIFHPIGLNSC